MQRARIRNSLKICFLIRSLGLGGAERQLTLLANGLAERGWDVSIAVLYPGGPLEAELTTGVRVKWVGKRHRWEAGSVLFRLWRWLRQERPNVLHSYLSVPNIVSAVLGAVVPSLKIVWGVRASRLELDAYDRFTALTERAVPLFARRADLIIANSEAGRLHCLASGYPGARVIVIPNGIDTRRFVRDQEARVRQRAAWGVRADETLIGLVGRLDATKGHEIFLRAASCLSKRHPGVRHICIGDGPEAARAALKAMAENLKIADRILWLPAVHDMPAVYSALDVACSSSFTEGFSNVLGEAMACGVPCVATRVGDSERLIGETGEVVPPGDPEALCRAWKKILPRIEREGELLGRRCRERILTHYTREHLLDRTAEALEGVVRRTFPRSMSEGC